MAETKKIKFILCRKGFDSGFGGIPSPILRDNTLLSMTIPNKNDDEYPDKESYKDLKYNDKEYIEIINSLKNSRKKARETNFNYCHLDPDLRKDVIGRNGKWFAAFGQSENAQSYLNNCDVKEGDIFLFFGWFRKLNPNSDKWEFEKGEFKDYHVVYGYLQVGDKVEKYEDMEQKCPWHPHNNKNKYGGKPNCVYIAKQYLELDGVESKTYPGSGVFKFNSSTVLTNENKSRSKWIYRGFYDAGNIYTETRKNAMENDEGVQYKGQWQEIVLKNDNKKLYNETLDWFKKMLESNKDELLKSINQDYYY
jgi:hypothetical protein